VKGKPLSAATIRTGPDYIEVPFVATHESKRGRGFGRCVVEAIEDVARALNIPRLLLCSTCETSVSNTWKRLGFFETTEQQLAGWNVEDSDLVHMQNTLQVGGHLVAGVGLQATLAGQSKRCRLFYASETNKASAASSFDF
jgi:GNAT superfamily N-acetyltransferase